MALRNVPEWRVSQSFTPELFPSANITLPIQVRDAFYTINDTAITVALALSFAISPLARWQLGLTLPFPITLTDRGQVVGTLTVLDELADDLIGGSVYADVANQRAELTGVHGVVAQASEITAVFVYRVR